MSRAGAAGGEVASWCICRSWVRSRDVMYADEMGKCVGSGGKKAMQLAT